MKKIYRNKHFKIVLKFGLFIFFLWMFDFSVGLFLSHCYQKQKSGLLYRATYSMDSTNADMLIFGASRANHHYVPSIFKKKLNLTCYNTGRDGETIFYNYAVLKSVLKRYSPKIVILDFSIKDFSNNEESYDRLAALLPYYESHPGIRPIVKLKSPFQKIKLISKIYPYNSLCFTMLIGSTNYNVTRDYINDDNGYIPLTDSFNQALYIDTTNINYQLDMNKINAYISFLKDCATSGVKIYVIVSPVCVKYLYQDKSIILAKRIAKKYNVVFYDYTNDPFYLNSNFLFADRGHLNENGAKIFTNQVINEISKNEYAIEKSTPSLSVK